MCTKSYFNLKSNVDVSFFISSLESQQSVHCDVNSYSLWTRHCLRDIMTQDGQLTLEIASTRGTGCKMRLQDVKPW